MKTSVSLALALSLVACGGAPSPATPTNDSVSPSSAPAVSAAPAGSAAPAKADDKSSRDVGACEKTCEEGNASNNSRLTCKQEHCYRLVGPTGCRNLCTQGAGPNNSKDAEDCIKRACTPAK